MPYVLFTKDQSSQPQEVVSAPVVDGLFAALLPSGAGYYDAVSGRRCTKSGGTGHTQLVGLSGRCFSIESSTGASVASYFTPVVSGATINTIAFISDRTKADAWGSNQWLSGSGPDYVRINPNNTSVEILRNSAVVASYSLPSTTAVVVCRVTDTTSEIWVNGALVASASHAVYGLLACSYVTWSQLKIPLIAYWAMHQPNSWIARFFGNPWQIFEPTQNSIWVPGAGGGNYSIPDSGSGSDSISISVAFGLADTGAGNDLPTPSAALTLLDDGASTDALSLAALLAVADTGAGNDAETITVAFALADSGSGADAILVLTQLLVSVSDAVSGVDGVSIQAQIVLADSGSGADTPVLHVSLSVADSASAADTLDVLQQLLISVADAGAGLDGMAIAINVPVGDAGTGTDVPAIQAWLALIESATGMDASVAFAAGQRVATILFKFAHRAMTFTLAARQISFTLN